MAASLDDPYTIYFTREEFEAFNQSSEGEYEGIGVLISTDSETGATVIVKIFEGSSAQEAGVMANDIIINIDDACDNSNNGMGICSNYFHR